MTLRSHLMEALRRHRGLIVLSDFDGTLASLADQPRAARLPGAVRRLLIRLAQHPRVRVGIISGRSLGTLKRLVPVPNAAYAGCHGLEIAWRAARFRHPRAVVLAPLLRQVGRLLQRKTSRYSGVLVEPKGLTVCLHYRRADPRVVPALRSIVRQILGSAPSLELLAGKKALELRPRVTWGKGEAVRLLRGLLARSLRARALTLYLGDDETDEEAFRALAGRAICVSVGRRRTRAAYRLRSPAATGKLLAWLARVLD